MKIKYIKEHEKSSIKIYNEREAFYRITIILIKMSHCPVIDGGLSNWSSWSGCSESCGEGIKSRTRTCTEPEPSSSGLDCVGELVNTIPCINEACPGTIVIITSLNHYIIMLLCH